MTFGKDAKDRTFIADVCQIEQAFNHRNRVMKGDHSIYNQFGCLIQNDNKNKQITNQLAFDSQDGSPDLKTLEQRGQTVG